MAKLTYRRFFNEGAAAFDYGLSKSRCPYAAGTAEHQNWVEGWVKADHEDIGDDRYTRPASGACDILMEQAVA